MIEVVKVISGDDPTREERIYGSIFGRASVNCPYEDVIFTEKKIVNHPELLDIIPSLPCTLFYKDDILICRKDNIIASEHIFKTIEILLNPNNMIEIQRYTAKWCNPCKIYSNLFNEAEQQLSDKANFITIDVDNSPELAAQNSIRNIPTTLFIKNGEVVKRQTGVLDTEQISQILTTL